jgi:di/tricarboxylate transporter
MPSELVSIVVLVAVFAVATVTGINMGVLGIVAAFGLASVLGIPEDDLLAGFPGDLFVILVGVTYLFGIASSNGTVNWLVQQAVKAVGGRTAAIPWVMFLVTAALTASGAVVPAAIAIVVPIAISFANRYGIDPVLMGLLVINGGTAGGFSPISIFGAVVNGVAERNELAANPTLLFVISFVFNLLLSVIVFIMFGGRKLLRQQVNEPGIASGSEPSRASTAAEETSLGEVSSLDRDRILTLIGIVVLVVTALTFDVNVGLVALSVAAVLSLVSPKATKPAVTRVAWSTVLLICGLVTYVALLERIGTIDWLGQRVSSINSALLAALVICYIGGIVSAFASTTGILAALIPLAVPLLQTGTVGAIPLLVALSVSSSVVDSSPFSTSGALTVANTPEHQRDLVFKRLMQWGMSMVVLAPPVAWLLFLVTGWL